MAKLYNLARVTTSTTGTGTITLGSAVSGFLSFADAGVQDQDEVSYAIKDGTSAEVGTGTYSSAGPTLTRTVSKSTNSDQPINLSGSAEVFITPLAEDYYTLEQVTDAIQALETGKADTDHNHDTRYYTQTAIDTALQGKQADLGLVGLATQQQAEAGTDNETGMTPLRVAQAIEALSSDPIGVNQTWQDVTASRAHSVAYQNTTGKPIMVAIVGSGSGTGKPFVVSDDGTTWGGALGFLPAGAGTQSLQVVVLAGQYYKMDGSINIVAWSELR